MAREVGTEGKLGGQADVKGVAKHLEETSPTASTPWPATSPPRFAISPR